MKVSLEFAHSSLATIDQQEISRSVEAALTVQEWLETNGHEVTTVILLDDKKVSPASAEERGRELLDLVATLGCPADSWFFETRLRRWLPQLGQLLPPQQVRKLDRDANRYLRQYGCLPCSVDIALWHSLRLGYLGESDIEPNEIAISVLGDGNAEFEELARRNFLNHLEGGPSNRIITLYYPESPLTTTNAHEMLNQLSLAIKEAS
ncbi:hypothetical protein [Arthrobacter sp. B1I2]|uniref:hypothetical protein n=1 Tax=Arthrobacter sp. B1I2 TaxID=3042263 RepID=UPI00277F9087|nr:hypothetical protein [Arthrobacter sp. B1I2]MDQ0733494.1 hypothetical protein [Arthrobacter sp. B1I2]